MKGSSMFCMSQGLAIPCPEGPDELKAGLRCSWAERSRVLFDLRYDQVNFHLY